MVEKRAALEQRDGLLAGIDEVVVFFALSGCRAHAENAVLAVQQHLTICWNVVGHQRRHTYTQIDDGTFVNILRDACGNFVFGAFGVGHLKQLSSRCRPALQPGKF